MTFAGLLSGAETDRRLVRSIAPQAAASVHIHVGHLQIPNLIRWQTAHQFTCVVKNPNDVNSIFAAAVNQEMPRRFGNTRATPRSLPDEMQVIGPDA